MFCKVSWKNCGVYEDMKKALGLKELIAIAVGGMIGGGIFTVLGIAVKMIGFLAPFAIAFGGFFALMAAYSYVKLGVYYKDEGATYAFFKRTFYNSHLAAAFIGWYTIFGYIATLSLYSYTFSAYIGSLFGFDEFMRKLFAVLIISLFALINLKSVKLMGEVEDLMVYIKLVILFIISIALISVSKYNVHQFVNTLNIDMRHTNIINIMMVASVTFVAYEGFQLVTNAVNDMRDPDKNIPRSIYISVILVAAIYFIIALGAVLSTNVESLAKYKEFALAFAAKKSLGNFAEIFVVLSAILATSSAINSTMYGAPHQMARIADDGYLPKILSKRKGTIPTNAIIAMALVSILLIIFGGLRVILEFGSITFLIVSFLMAYANFTIRDKTNSSDFITIFTMIGLFIGIVLIFYYEYQTDKKQLLFVFLTYIILSVMAFLYAKKNSG